MGLGSGDEVPRKFCVPYVAVHSFIRRGGAAELNVSDVRVKGLGFRAQKSPSLYSRMPRKTISAWE